MAETELGPLRGLMVVDLSTTSPGAQVGQVLADYGATVVMVEPEGGSPLRAQHAFPMWARGKRSITADITTAEGQEVVRELVAAADVLIETYRPSVLDALGLGYGALSASNPALIYTSITGWGRTGPYADVKGYEGLVLARLGVHAAFKAMKHGDEPPFVCVPWASFAAAQTAVHGTLAAIVERERSGRGQLVEASLTRGFTALDTWGLTLHHVAVTYPDAFTSVTQFSPDGVPNSPFAYFLPVALTADGRWMQFAQAQPHLFGAMMKALGLEYVFTDPEWAGVPVFPDAERRLGLWQLILERVRQRTVAEWAVVFDEDPNVFAELFRNGPEVLDHPQLVYGDHVVVIDDPELGPVRQPGAIVRMDGTPARVDRPAPRRGEHDDELASLATAPAARPEPSGGADELPLAGVTILELAVLFAAPYGATQLVDLGARVFKVEALTGDPIRPMMGFPESAGAKAMQGKDSICVDITTPEGLAIVHELTRRSDLVLQGFRAGAATRHGVDPASLLAVNPDIAYLSAPGYGLDGPCGHRPAFAPSIGAAAGVGRRAAGDSVAERPDLTMAELQDNSIRLGAAGTIMNAQADGFAALGVATSLLLGLVAKVRGMGGQSMLSSMLSTASHAMSEAVVDSPNGPPVPAPDTELRGLNALYRIYATSDGWVFLAAPKDREWTALVSAMAAHAPLGTDARFTTATDRAVNDADLAEALAKAFSTRPTADWERELLAADVGCVEVVTDPIETVLCSEDFGRAMGLVTDVDHPTFDHHPRASPHIGFSRSPVQAKPGVLAGQSTDAILTEIGYDADAIADLRARKIVA